MFELAALCLVWTAIQLQVDSALFNVRSERLIEFELLLLVELLNMTGFL